VSYGLSMTSQDRIRELLGKVNLPSKRIDVYGSQIVVTCRSESAAEKWAMVLGKFATVTKVALKDLDETKVNKGDVMLPSRVTVWRTYATI